MFLEVEEDATKSFLTKSSWKELIEEGNKENNNWILSIQQ
jgi:hypothetical protein